MAAKAPMAMAESTATAGRAAALPASSVVDAASSPVWEPSLELLSVCVPESALEPESVLVPGSGGEC